MQYANITVSDLNRTDFVAQKDLSQEELSLSGGGNTDARARAAEARGFDDPRSRDPRTRAARLSIIGGFGGFGGFGKSGGFGGGRGYWY